MSRLEWDLGNPRYMAGVDRGVLYPAGKSPEPWNGLTAVKESLGSSSGSDGYVDGMKYRKTSSSASFGGTITAITFPDSFGSGIFGLCYRVITSGGYDLHLVYNAIASPSDSNSSSIDDSVDAGEFSWDFATKPVGVPDARPSAHLVVDGERTYPWVLAELEDILYGTDLTDPKLPNPLELMTLFEAGAMLRVIDNGDGTVTFIGRTDEVVHMVDGITAEISWSSVVYLDDHTCQISSF